MNINFSQIFLTTFFILGLITQPTYAGIGQFDTRNSLVQLDEFKSGGPSKDGIPSLDKPQFVSAQKADYLQGHDKVIGIIVGDQVKAYPIRLLNWHEVVNDQISNSPIAVTWCPLTRSAVAFERKVNGQTLEFGVSGLLYNSNVVMYDRQSQGLWSQLNMGGLTGDYAGDGLNHLPLQVIDWEDWFNQYPNTLVLSNKTGYFRDYNRDPYVGYHNSDDIIFPIQNSDNRLRPKSLVIGVKINDITKAYPLANLMDNRNSIIDRVGGTEIEIRSLKGGAVEIAERNGKAYPSVVAYWFAWSTFNQDTLVYEHN